MIIQIIQCGYPRCLNEAQIHWIVVRSNGQKANFMRCNKHAPYTRSMYESVTGKCRSCFRYRFTECNNRVCANYKPKESEQIVSDEPLIEDKPFIEAVGMVDLSADELRTLMNALTVLNHHPLVPADEYPFPRQALYARLRSELEQIEGWKAR